MQGEARTLPCTPCHLQAPWRLVQSRGTSMHTRLINEVTSARSRLLLACATSMCLSGRSSKHWSSSPARSHFPWVAQDGGHPRRHGSLRDGIASCLHTIPGNQERRRTSETKRKTRKTSSTPSNMMKPRSLARAAWFYHLTSERPLKAGLLKTVGIRDGMIRCVME